jgi:exodeoxyribonuclease V alpha subunit
MSDLSQSEGHTFVTSSQILEHVTKLFRRHALDPFPHGLSDIAFFNALKTLRESGDVVADGDHIYLGGNWTSESESARCLADVVAEGPVQFQKLEEILQEFEEIRGVQLSDEQRQAFHLLQDSRVCVVSGYPGTGKTLLISAFVHLFESLNLHYTLMSPTGIAAKRLSQVTSKPASTIHRALGYKRDGSWEFNRHNRYTCDAVIVDEMSMVDISTFYRLVSSVSSSTILVLVGDSAQLPSVGAGYVLNNLMRCPLVSHVSLTRIYRQTKQSDIVSVAHSILRGEQVDTSFNRESEFCFLNFAQEDVLEELCKLTSKMKEKEVNFQVIAPTYQGDLGVNNLNKRLRDILNPDFSSGRAAKFKSGDSEIY